MSLDEKKMVLEWRNHPNIRKYMYNRYTISLEEHLNYIESLKNAKDKRYFLVKGDENYIGVIDFTELDLDRGETHFGIYAKPNLKGVGNILMQTILDYAFNQMGIRTIKLEVLRTNVRAISLYRKFNFKTISQKGDFIHMELRDEVGKF
jgi:UDP-4-amino-4,6-dideoxy-N-acetyl-beta-L-altrosamine N-acetyltransferase